jgi:hypothetical protein
MGASTMCTALNSGTLPRLETVKAIVIACGGDDGDLDLFVTAWRRIRLGQENAGPAGEAHVAVTR